jgi:hypothetical protein
MSWARGFGDRPGHADARQIRVGDKGIEAMSVPVDAQEGHVPAGMIGKPRPEDNERRLPTGVRERQKKESVPRAACILPGARQAT